MKKLCIILSAVLVLMLAGCRSSAGEALQTAATEVDAGALPAAEETVGIAALTETEAAPEEEILEEGPISDFWQVPYAFQSGKLIRNGEPRDAVICITPESIIFYGDEAMKEILGYADLPEAVRGRTDAEMVLDLLDLNDDGWSDIILNMTWGDGTTASLLWVWNEFEGYAFDAEMSRLPGE